MRAYGPEQLYVVSNRLSRITMIHDHNAKQSDATDDLVHLHILGSGCSGSPADSAPTQHAADRSAGPAAEPLQPALWSHRLRWLQSSGQPSVMPCTRCILLTTHAMDLQSFQFHFCLL